MATADDRIEADEAASVRSPLLGSSATPRGNRQHRSLTSSPTRSAVPNHRLGPKSAPRATPPWSPPQMPWSPMSMSPDESIESAPASPPDNFWRLLPLAQDSRRNSTTEDNLDASQAASWNASTSSVETARHLSPTPAAAWGDGPGGETRGAMEQRRRNIESPRELESRLPAVVNRRHEGHFSTAMHGTMFVGQCIVALATLSIMVAVAAGQMTKTQPGLEESTYVHGKPPLSRTEVDEYRLWICLSPALAIILATCVSVTLLHETLVLSTLAVFFFETLILTMTTATSLSLWIWILTHAADRAVKGPLVACLIMMEGTAVFGFARAGLVWWLVEDHGEFEFDGPLYNAW